MNVGTNPQLLLSKMQDEIKTDLYLANEKIAKSIEEKKLYIRTMTRALAEPSSERELDALETEVREVNDAVARLVESNLKQTSVTDDKLGLFRQQAAIVARKKDSTAGQLQEITNEIRSLEEEFEHRRASTVNANKALKGEDLKRYVNDIRAKSLVFKQKKGELAALTTEYGVLQRTEEILKGRERSMRDSYKTLRKSSGSTGSLNLDFDDVDLDEPGNHHRHADSLDELQMAIASLKSSIQAKKNALTPMMQELRSTRQEVQTVEVEHTQKKRVYDAAMAGYDSENTQDAEVLRLDQDLKDGEAHIASLKSQIEQAKADYERAQEELRAYRGDPSLEAEQGRRGFKTYRDLFTKQLNDFEHALKTAKDQQKEVKGSFQEHQHQMDLFTHLQRILRVKVEYNRKSLAGGFRDSVGDGVALISVALLKMMIKSFLVVLALATIGLAYQKPELIYLPGFDVDQDYFEIILDEDGARYVNQKPGKQVGSGTITPYSVASQAPAWKSGPYPGWQNPEWNNEWQKRPNGRPPVATGAAMSSTFDVESRVGPEIGSVLGNGTTGTLNATATAELPPIATATASATSTTMEIAPTMTLPFPPGSTMTATAAPRPLPSTPSEPVSGGATSTNRIGMVLAGTVTVLVASILIL
ncbi:hypothetical protein SmJEL517_g02039 [Synchytrium microbalum]|uniref:Uncharacterized protein n=1 Tax=Synchytrium microbalum TaxID=1806994 RepID=A0A507C760_9FUNG|nr:uncharacterized protein SmJEL517_g02039 [Synchytrium microbalum]TPX35452.1 hypothetical protein SmJEL517_g02039 [Synchytrium microbalum]